MSSIFEGRYWTDTVNVHPLEECFSAIRQRDADKSRRIEFLEKEVKKLTDEKFKDNELKEMQESLERAQSDMMRGFAITEKEKQAINNWKDEHDKKAHNLNTLQQKLDAGGCCGGRYYYEFHPTSIFTIGKIVCGACGESFTFQED